MDFPLSTDNLGLEDKRESKPWTVEEKRIFYDGFGKHYKKFALIHEMLPSRSFTQVRQFFYRETKRIQSLLGEAQNLINWDDKDQVLCVYNSYASFLRTGNDPTKTMKSKRYLDRLRHNIEKIKKRQQLDEAKRLEKGQDIKMIHAEVKPTPMAISVYEPTIQSKEAPFNHFNRSLTIPHHVDGSSSGTMVIRIVPANDMFNNALRACSYSPLLELTIRSSYTVRLLFAHLRNRWETFCKQIQGVFRLVIASSSTAGVWVENGGSVNENSLFVDDLDLLPSMNSLLSSRMEHGGGVSETIYGNNINMTMTQLQALTNSTDIIKLTVEYNRGNIDIINSYCISSHSRRIHSFILSSLLPCINHSLFLFLSPSFTLSISPTPTPFPSPFPIISLPLISSLAENPSLYSSLVGPVQSETFMHDIYGSHFSLPSLQVVSREETGGQTTSVKKKPIRRNKKKDGEKPKRRATEKKKKEEKPTKEMEFPISLSTPSFLTSFTDAIPYMNSISQPSSTSDTFPASLFPLHSLALSQQEIDLQEKEETGPLFTSFLSMFNSNGWLDKEGGNMRQNQLSTSTSLLPSSSASNLFNPSFLLTSPPRFDSFNIKENKTQKCDEKNLPEINSRLSNLFNRMSQPETNSMQNGLSLPSFNSTGNPNNAKNRNSGEICVSFNNTELFQKDDSLCFPFSFESSV